MPMTLYECSHCQWSQYCFTVSGTCVRGSSSIIKPPCTGSNLVHTQSEPTSSSDIGMGVHWSVTVVEQSVEEFVTMSIIQCTGPLNSLFTDRDSGTGVYVHTVTSTVGTEMMSPAQHWASLSLLAPESFPC